MLKKTVTMSVAEKIYFETNTPIMMNWRLSLSKEKEGSNSTNDYEEPRDNQKTGSDRSTEWSFSSSIDGIVGMYCDFYDYVKWIGLDWIGLDWIGLD